MGTAPIDILFSMRSSWIQIGALWGALLTQPGCDDGADPEKGTVDATGQAELMDAGEAQVDAGGGEDANTDDDGGLIPEADAALQTDAAVEADAEAEADAARPEPRVVFVAAGWGGRRITSCDGGRTWIQDTQAAPEAEDDWHRSYTPKGLVFAGGRFLFLTGWGADSQIQHSSDGLSWSTAQLDTSYAAVGWSGDRFVAVSTWVIAESEDAERWIRLEDPPLPEYSRAGLIQESVQAVGADGSAQFKRPEDPAWRTMAACEGMRHGHIGFEGGFAASPDRLISVGHDGDTCAVDLTSGEALGIGQIGTPVPGPPVWFNDAFHVATGDQLHRSADGLNWTATPLPEGVRFELLARAPSGSPLVGVAQSGDQFYFSEEGQTWQQAQAPEGNGLLYVVAGEVQDFTNCPSED